MNNESVIRRATAGILAMLVSLFVGSASAGIDEVMRDRFNAMVSTYPAAVVEGEHGTTVTGGRLRVRMRQESFQIMNLRHPSIKAGCSGIDIFGGSFSIISADAVVQMLEDIAASAAAFFFKLAIRSISDQIANVMGEIEDKLGFLNKGLLDSCEAGRNIAAGFAERMTIGAETEAGVAGTASAQDNAESMLPWLRSALFDLSSRSPAVGSELTPGNIVYRALRGVLGTAFSSTTSEVERQLMSLTGTVVICFPGRDGCPGRAPDTVPGSKTTTSEAVSKTYLPIMSLRQFIYGSDGGDGVVSIYECADPVRCYDPAPVQQPSERGTRDMLDTVMLGGGVGSGLIGKWKNARTVLSPEELSVDRLDQRHINLIKRIARINDPKARMAYAEFRDAIAIEWTVPLLLEMMDIAAGATTRKQEAGGDGVAELFTRARQTIQQESLILHAEAGISDESVAAYEKWVETMQNQRAVAR